MDTRLALILALCAAPAWAERTTLTPVDAADHFAVIEVRNIFGLYHGVETHETQHGPVSVEYKTTVAHAVNDPASADTACVVALPDGVVAVPMCVDVLEQETGRIALMIFEGM
jgi:hypothetical protein